MTFLKLGVELVSCPMSNQKMRVPAKIMIQLTMPSEARMKLAWDHDTKKTTPQFMMISNDIHSQRAT